MASAKPAHWLLLIHQLPLKPDYFRVKIWRRLQGLGAVAIKNSVYVLPRSDQAVEDLRWVQREIEEGGGEASLCEAEFLDGLSDEEVIAAFRAARDADYGALGEEARRIAAEGRKERASGAPASPSRLRRRLEQIVSIDFFAAAGRAGAEAALLELERLGREPSGADAPGAPRKPRAATWVTRRGIQVDRIASAWLIRRFIDIEARFRFVDPARHRPKKGEIRFDMFEAEYGHAEGCCTFETLLRSFGPKDDALAAIGEMIHDLDLKDGRFDRPETEGLGRLLAGIKAVHRSDPDRLGAGGAALDALYAGLGGTAKLR